MFWSVFYYLDSKLLFSCILLYLGAFGIVWLPYSVQNRQNWCKSSCYDVASEFFVMKAPDPTHWTLNTYFGAFRTIWVHLGLFGCMQHSVQNGSNWCKSSCHEVALEFFATNAPDPPPLDPKLMFWCVSYYLGAFGTFFLCSTTYFKTFQTF